MNDVSAARGKSGGKLLVEALEANGVDRVFCVPGESYLAVLDSLHDASIPVTVCRQEGGAAMMADAWARLSGKPGICMVTRGPGATNASAGVHVAQQDSTPMILFVGQIERSMRGRDAFQEIDFTKMFGSIAKWVAEIDDAARVPEMVARAFSVACSGRPGPVVLALPEDMLVEMADVAPPRPAAVVETHPGLSQMAELQKRLWAAKRPFVIAGGSNWSEAAVERLKRFAERFDLPVSCSFRRQMLFDHDHPNYAGDLGLGANPALIERIKASDLVLLAGGRLSEAPSQAYTLLDIPEPAQALVHVHAGAEELGRVYQPALAIHATPDGFTAALEGLQPPVSIPWSEETRAANAAYHAWSDQPPATPGPLQMGEVMTWLRHNLPDDAIMTNGAGNYAIWLHRFHRFRKFGTQLAPTCGTMGYGLPAAIAAKLHHPDRDVICFAGDGCLQMTINELGTAMQAGAAVIIICVDNGIYGTIRMHQEREYPGRVSGTMMTNPDFAELIRVYGGHGECVRETAEFGPAFERARASGKLSLLHLHLDPEVITPTTTLSAIRSAAMERA